MNMFKTRSSIGKFVGRKVATFFGIAYNPESKFAYCLGASRHNIGVELPLRSHSIKNDLFRRASSARSLSHIRKG